MNTNIQLTVEMEDVVDGKVGDPCGCPIALALKRQFPEAKVHVGGQNCSVGDNMYHLSSDAQDFVRDFDLGAHAGMVKQYHFELTPVRKSGYVGP